MVSRAGRGGGRRLGELRRGPFLFDHNLPLARAVTGPIGNLPGQQHDPGEWLDLETVYAWLADRVGFFPLFLSVGGGLRAIRESGYLDQWSALGRSAPSGLFSWSSPPPSPPAVYSDIGWWTAVINDLAPPQPRAIDAETLDHLFRPGRSPEEWLRGARRRAHVQVVVPEVDLASAGRVWCPDVAARQELVSRGFPATSLVVRDLRGRPLED